MIIQTSAVMVGVFFGVGFWVLDFGLALRNFFYHLSPSSIIYRLLLSSIAFFYLQSPSHIAY